MLGFDLGSVAALQRYKTEFEDLGRIGSGGFSTVTKVKNKMDCKYYALKTVRIKPSEFKGEVGDYLEKVLGESRVLSGLRHPNILQYNGCWIAADFKTEADFSSEEEHPEEEGELELVMEEYSGNSLGFEFEHLTSSAEKKKESIKKNKREKKKENRSDNIFGTDLYNFKEIRLYLLSELGEYSLQKHIYLRNQVSRKTETEKKLERIENYRLILEIIDGLIYIHSQKVIHRDIKLQNIILDKELKCKIIDFGLAKRVRNLKSLNIEKFEHNSKKNEDEECEEQHSSSVGTRIFSSPEQSNSENYDHRTDIYSLAMVIGVMFSYYKTAHEESEILLNLRNKKLDDFEIDSRLKTLMSRALSEQKYRPELQELKNCVKKLLKEELENMDESLRKAKKLLYLFKQKGHKKVFDELQDVIKN